MENKRVQMSLVFGLMFIFASSAPTTVHATTAATTVHATTARATTAKPTTAFLSTVELTTTPKWYNNVLDICTTHGATKFASLVRSTPYLSQIVDSTGSESNSSLTVFAFTDAAYNRAPKAFQTASRKELEWALEYHVALGPVTIGKPPQDYRFPSLFPSPPDGHSLPLQDIRINKYNIYNFNRLGFHTVRMSVWGERLVGWFALHFSAGVPPPPPTPP